MSLSILLYRLSGNMIVATMSSGELKGRKQSQHRLEMHREQQGGPVRTTGSWKRAAAAIAVGYSPRSAHLVPSRRPATWHSNAHLVAQKAAGFGARYAWRLQSEPACFRPRPALCSRQISRYVATETCQYVEHLYQSSCCFSSRSFAMRTNTSAFLSSHERHSQAPPGP